MTKRKNRNAPKPADQQPQTGEAPVSGAAAAPETETGVVLDGGVAAQAGGSQQQAEPDGSAGENTGVVNDVDDEPVAPIDGVVKAAEDACWSVLNHITEYHELDLRTEKRLAVMSGEAHSRGTNAIAELMRKIGHEGVKPAVYATHLKIHGLIDDDTISDVEHLVLTTFVNVVAGIDAFEAKMAAWVAEAMKPVEEPVPVPVEETIMRTSDDPYAVQGERY